MTKADRIVGDGLVPSRPRPSEHPPADRESFLDGMEAARSAISWSTVMEAAETES